MLYTEKIQYGKVDNVSIQASSLIQARNSRSLALSEAGPGLY